MNDQADPMLVAWWAKNLQELDLEIAREALLCGVKLLDEGVVDRVLRNDASVCTVDNPAAFAKLHVLVMMHFAIRKKALDALGPVRTARIEAYVIERLRKAFAEAMGERASP